MNKQNIIIRQCFGTIIKPKKQKTAALGELTNDVTTIETSRVGSQSGPSVYSIHLGVGQQSSRMCSLVYICSNENNVSHIYSIATENRINQKTIILCINGWFYLSLFSKYF